VLAGQQGGRNQQCDLFSILNGFERSSDGNFGFTKADVSGDEPVHGHFGFHVLFDLVNGRELVGCFNVGKRLFEFILPRAIG